MSREKEAFRDNLERLNEVFDHELLTVAEVSKFTGASRNTVSRWFRFNETTHRISKADLARQMCS